VCMILGLAPGHGSKLRPAGCTKEIFGRKCLGFFPTKALRSSSASSLVACDYQSRCCAPVLGNYVDYVAAYHEFNGLCCFTVPDSWTEPYRPIPRNFP
jgi:hypothetical protein